MDRVYSAGFLKKTFFALTEMRTKSVRSVDSYLHYMYEHIAEPLAEGECLDDCPHLAGLFVDPPSELGGL